ncbi:MAG: TMEM43 family protein [Candidatus Saccharibacteria bacterium]|nr:TMEM43 family protein [Candidatus Saccharibacteria bacterium]
MAKTKKKISSALNIVLVAIGLILIGISLFYKDGTNTLVDEAGNEIVQADSKNINAANDGKLIILSDIVSTASTLKDEFFGISKATFKLKRVVETYQWKEICETSCTYEKVWFEGIIDSSNYDENHKNPSTQQYTSEEYMEKNLQIGAYVLSDKLINDLEYDTDMGPDEMTGLYAGGYTLSGEYITNVVDAENPKIGDFRISYKYAKDKKVTVVAKQVGNSFGPFYTSKKQEIYSIEPGEKTAEEYISGLEAQKSPLNLILAIVGVFFACFGISANIFGKLKKK